MLSLYNSIYPFFKFKCFIYEPIVYMSDPYQNNEMWQDMQPGHLIPGNKYHLVLNKVPFRYENLPVPLLQQNMEFIGHDMLTTEVTMNGSDPPYTWTVQDMYILRFRFENSDSTMIVENTPQNKIYRLRTLSEDIQPRSSGWLALNRGGITDPNLRNQYMGKFGGKRKNNKKKTAGKKKAKSVRKKRKSLKKDRKTKKTKKK